MLNVLVCQFCFQLYGIDEKLPKLPLINNLTWKKEGIRKIPEDILTATTLRELLDSMLKHMRLGTAKFDDVFGERA